MPDSSPVSSSSLVLNDGTATGVEVPAYDRSRLVAGVVHFGVGGFHRAHQAIYFDELARRGVTGWGVVGVGVHHPEIRDVLAAQDNLFTVVQRGPEDTEVQVVAAVVECLLLAEDAAAVRRRLTDPGVRLVTLTITADGYDVDEAAQGRPDSVFGALAAALDERRRADVAPFTVLSCDNLPDSGAATRRAVLAAARRYGPDLVRWIDQRVAFPGSMVDRITPATTPQDRDAIEEEFGVTDRWPVITEPFAQWVVEDAFCNDRPPLDQVGVLFVPDVTPYKLIKSRLLNGTHCALGYLGTLAGCRRLDEAMADPELHAFAEALMREEVLPSLPDDVPDLPLHDYVDTLLDRFANPAISDDLIRLGRRGSSKVPHCLLPSLREARAAGRPARLLTLALAGWLRYLRGVDLDGEPIPVPDARADELRALAEQGGRDPLPLLALTDIFGDLAEDEQCVTEIGRLLTALDTRGVRQTIRSVLSP